MQKKNKFQYFLTLGLAAVFFITSLFVFDSTAYAVSSQVKSVTLKIGKKKVTGKTYSLTKGKKASIKVAVNPEQAKKSITFKTSNKTIAEVSKDGIVTAKKKGTATISVTVLGKDEKAKTEVVKIKVTRKTKDNSASDSENESNSSSNEEQVTIPTPKVEDLTIQDGENEIYGKLYTPEEEGIYPAIILSHGYNGIHADFTNECRYFAQNGYIAYSFDFCGGSGRSKSSGKTTDMTIFTEKENLLAVFHHISSMENVDSERVFLLGGSQGGLVTALATEEVAENVKGLILYFPAFNIPDDWRKTFPTVEKIPETYDFWGLKLGKEFFASMHDFDPFENIGSYSKNVLIIYGRKDAIVPLSYIEKAKETYQNAELIIMENEGHGFTPVGGVNAREQVLRFMQEQLINN